MPQEAKVRLARLNETLYCFIWRHTRNVLRLWISAPSLFSLLRLFSLYLIRFKGLLLDSLRIESRDSSKQLLTKKSCGLICKGTYDLRENILVSAQNTEIGENLSIQGARPASGCFSQSFSVNQSVNTQQQARHKSRQEDKEAFEAKSPDFPLAFQ